MSTFVLGLIAPRPNVAQTLTDTEREIMHRHAARRRPYLERGDMVVFGTIRKCPTFGVGIARKERHAYNRR